MIRRPAALLLLASAALSLGATNVAIRDVTGRGFAPDLISYTLPLQPKEAGGLGVTAANGTPVACQFEPAADGGTLVSFVTGLPTNQAVAFTIGPAAAAPAPAATALRVERRKNVLTLANDLMAVRVPAPVDKPFRKPVPASTLPAPILGFRSGPDGAWLGAGRILTKRPVKAMRVTQSANGPVFAETLYELEFEPAGYYRARVRVIDQVPMAHVIEEYDLGSFATTNEEWELDLAKGWSPDQVETARCWGNGGVDTGRVIPLTNFAFQNLVSDGAYNRDSCSLLGLSESARTNAGAPLAGIAPLRRGTWRRAVPLPLATASKGAFAVRFPMARLPGAWPELSPFSVVTHDDALPATYARRHWGLVLGAPPQRIIGGIDGKVAVGPVYQARLAYGVIGLDRYKDFILDWPDARPVHPRLFLDTNTLDRARAALDGPLGPRLLKVHPGLSGKAEDYKQHMARLHWSVGGLIRSAFSLPIQSHHACSDVGPVLASVDDLLAWPGLPESDRARLRSQLAFLAYLFTDPDVTGQGNGAHTGNPNMSIARQLWISAAMALIPDHPMRDRWLAYMAAFTEFKLADNMAPGGGWFEPGTYHMWAYERLMVGLKGLQRLGAPNRARLMDYHRQDADYYLNLLTPHDSRYGARMISGFGNSATHYSGELLQMAGLLEKDDPALAGALAWAWDANGRQAPPVPGDGGAWIEPREPALTSRFYPGFGVIFRAHQGPDETFMLLRSGHLWSHWTLDQGNFSLYSKGAALIPAQCFTYFTSEIKDFSPYSDLRFGTVSNEMPYGWPDSNILDYHFGNRAQYAWASAGYPEWALTNGGFRWERQVVFLPGRTPRSPNYFVFRDSTTSPGKPASWFNLLATGVKSNATARGETLTLTTEWPESLDLTFAGAGEVKPDYMEENQILNLQYNVYGPTYRTLTGTNPVSPNWFRADGKPVDREKLQVPDRERKLHVRLAGKPGSDFFWVAYPRGPGEPAATVERLTDNVVKVTHPEGTDYILLSPTNAIYKNGDVTLKGMAAVVRVSSGPVSLCLLGGEGGVGYKDQFYGGAAPIEKTEEKSAGIVEDVVGDTDEIAIHPVPGGVRFTAGQPVYAELSHGSAGVRGLGPFDLTFTATGITGRVSGKARNLVMSHPSGIRRPMVHMDGVRWLSGFADSFSPSFAQTNLQFGLAIGVTDGEHTIDIREWRSPPFPPL